MHALSVAVHAWFQVFSKLIILHIAVAEHVLGREVGAYLSHVSHSLADVMRVGAVLQTVLLVESLVRGVIVPFVEDTIGDVVESLTILASRFHIGGLS